MVRAKYGIAGQAIDNVLREPFEQKELGKISDERVEKRSSVYESEQKEENSRFPV